ncbi:MAG: hypothetical protein IJW14_02005 [Oscillospiraceae bacterium]|nr:hypothetical protein [Oscillospiraceae bacterium]
MSTLKKVVLVLTILTCIVLIAVFWGSIFSICMILALVGAPGVYLYNRFLNTDEKSDFTEEF